MSGEFLELRNEFAWVRIAIDQAGNGPRLHLEDRKSGLEIRLDPLELAALAVLHHAEVALLADPSRRSPQRRAESALHQAIEPGPA